MGIINDDSRNCAQGSSEGELRRGVFSLILEVAARGVALEQFEIASRSGRADLAASIGRTHHVVSATWSHTRAVARQILNDAGRADLPWYHAVICAAKLGMTALPDPGQREQLISDLKAGNTAPAPLNTITLANPECIERPQALAQLNMPISGVSGTTTDYSTARKERWRIAVIREALDSMLPRNGRENLRVVSLTGVYCEREVKHLVAIGLKPANILAVEGTKDPELVKIFHEQAASLGIQAFNGTLEQAFKRFRDPFDVVLLDFPGQLSPSYMELAHHIPLAKDAFVMFNLMASREHRFTQDVLESTHDIVFGERFLKELDQRAQGVVSVALQAKPGAASALADLKLASLPTSILSGTAALGAAASPVVITQPVAQTFQGSPGTNAHEQPLGLSELREQIADCTLLKFFGVGFERMSEPLREELLELTNTFGVPGPIGGSIADRLSFYRSLDNACENAGATCIGALKYHQNRVSLPNAAGWIILMGQQFFSYPSIVQAQRLAYQSEVGSRRTFITSVAHLRSNNPPSGAWYRPLEHFARSLVIGCLKSTYDPRSEGKLAVTILTPDGRPIGSNVITGKCSLRLVSLPGGAPVAEVMFSAIQRKVLENFELQQQFPLSASKNFTALERKIIE